LGVNDLEQRLAALAVRVGVGVRPGQDVVVLAWDVEQASLARSLAPSPAPWRMLRTGRAPGS
jgi:leucyl aminopeptidase (aminopeptidase T)